MKKFITILAVVMIALPANAIQQSSTQNSSSNNKTKVYSSTGSLMEYRETQSNGNVKTYNRYHQYTGVYKQDGGKIKYKPKR